MIRTQKSAVAAISYGLIAALVIAVSLGALAATGVDIENIFSTTGNALSATMTTETTATPPNPLGTPNANLTSGQQSEIVNAAAEIAAGTASAACLQYMNNFANVASMASNGATCLGPGLNIAPPQQPVKAFFSEYGDPVITYPDGQIYAVGAGVTGGATSVTAQGIWLYNDGFVTNNYNWVTCSETSNYSPYYSPSTTMTTQGTSISCTGGTSTGDLSNNVDNTDVSQSAPMGYAMGYMGYTW